MGEKTNAHSPKKLIKSNNKGEKRRKTNKQTILNLTLQTSKENQKQLPESVQINFSILSQKKY